MLYLTNRRTDRGADITIDRVASLILRKKRNRIRNKTRMTTSISSKAFEKQKQKKQKTLKQLIY